MKRPFTSIGILALLAALIAAGCARNQDGVPNAQAARTPAVQKARYETLVIPMGPALSRRSTPGFPRRRT